MATTTKHLLLYSLTLLLAASEAAAKEKCHPSDKKTLLDIKKFYKNDYVFTSWTASSDCCSDWYMLKCDPKSHRITSLSVSTNSLPGLISPSISDLPFLQHLTLRKLPKLTGPIPQSLSKLKTLISLSLDSNSLTGSIPDFLHTLNSLNFIDLSFNKLTGTIPNSLPLAPSLNYLNLESNFLTGGIPNSFQNRIPNSFHLILSRNRLAGPIPKSLGDVNFAGINLSRNNFSGDASFLFGANKPIYQMDLSRNLFEFDMSKVVVPSQLNWLLLDHNRIYGRLPESLGKVEGMNNFNVSFNLLCGKIPSGGRMNGFSKYEFLHNKCLCGFPLSACKSSE